MTAKEKLRLECLKLAVAGGPRGDTYVVATAKLFEGYITGVRPSKPKPEPARSTPTYAGHQP